MPPTHIALEEFEGKDVVEVAIEIPGIAGGLQDAMKFGPSVFRQAEEGCLVLKFVTQKIRYEPVKKEDPGGDQKRIQILTVLAGTFVDEAVVADALAAQDKIIEEGRKREEEAKGIQRLGFEDGSGPAPIPDGASDDERAFIHGRNHANGSHAGQRVEGCEVCEQEDQTDPEDLDPEAPDPDPGADPATAAPADPEGASVAEIGSGRRRRGGKATPTS